MSEPDRGPAPSLRSSKIKKDTFRNFWHMTTPLEWEKLVAELESQALSVGTSEGAKTLKSKVQEAMTEGRKQLCTFGHNRSLRPAGVGSHRVVEGERLHQHQMSSLRQKMQDALNIIIRILERPGPV